MHRVGGDISTGRTYAYVWRIAVEGNLIAEQVQFCKTRDEVMALYSSRAEKDTAIEVWKKVQKRQLKLQATETSLYPWQRSMVTYLEGPGNSRHVFWIADYMGGPKGQGGNLGKSEFIKFIQNKHLKSVYIVESIPRSRDLSTIIQGALEDGWNGRILFFDIPRSAQTWDVYGSLEAVCNGMITATKYQGGTVTWDAEHIMVLSNFLPTISAMSADRWHIYRAVDHTPYNPALPRGMQVNFESMPLEMVEKEHTRIHSLSTTDALMGAKPTSRTHA